MQLPGMPRWISSASQHSSSAILMQGGSLQGTACPRQLSARHGAPINKRPSHHAAHAAEGERQPGTGSLRQPRIVGGFRALGQVAGQGTRCNCSAPSSLQLSGGRALHVFNQLTISVTAALGHSNNSIHAPQPGTLILPGPRSQDVLFQIRGRHQNNPANFRGQKVLKLKYPVSDRLFQDGVCVHPAFLRGHQGSEITSLHLAARISSSHAGLI